MILIIKREDVSTFLGSNAGLLIDFTRHFNTAILMTNIIKEKKIEKIREEDRVGRREEQRVKGERVEGHTRRDITLNCDTNDVILLQRNTGVYKQVLY